MALGFSTIDNGSEETSTDSTMTSAEISPGAGSVLYVTIVGTHFETQTASDGAVSGLSGTWAATAPAIIYGSRRCLQVWRGTGCTGTGTLTIESPGSLTSQDMAYVIDEVTGADAATPNNTPVTNNGMNNVTLGDVGTVDAGDAVYVVGGHENGTNNFACTGYTGITTLGSLTNVRQIRTFYDDSSPDTTPNLTSDGGDNTIGGWAFVINVAAGGATLPIPVAMHHYARMRNN